MTQLLTLYLIFHCHFPGPSDSYTLEEMKLRWSNDSDPVQTNEDLTLPQFELLDVKTHHFYKSYITGRLQVGSCHFQTLWYC